MSEVPLYLGGDEEGEVLLDQAHQLPLRRARLPCWSRVPVTARRQDQSNNISEH